MPLRILIANYEFPPIGGGASKVSYELAKKLVVMGHDVVVLTSRFGDLTNFEECDGIAVHRVWSWRKGIHDSGLRGAFTYLIAAFPALRRLLRTERIDVVHYFFGLPTGLLSLYSHTIAKRPYIVSLRGSDVPLYDRDSRKLMFLHRLTRPLSHRIWRKASGVFAVSDGLRELAEASFPDIPVGVIHNGIEVENPACDRRIRDEDSPMRLLCVSRLIPRKGISDLMQALAWMDDLSYDLTIVGTGPSEALLRRDAVRLGIGDRVLFAGYKRPEELKDYYSKADVFVLPTRSDAFANVILEAMAAALPVVATRVGGVAEAVVDGETGILVNPRQPEELMAAIRQFAHDRRCAEEYGRAGQRRALENFTWAGNASRHLEAYRGACQGAG